MSHSLRRITNHLWFRQSELYLTNSGVFVSRGHALLIDPAVFPHEIRDIADFLTSHDIAPRLIALTHSHWDHILGPEQFPGVETIAHATYRACVRRDSRTILDDIEQWCRETGLRRSVPFNIPAPDVVCNDTLDVRIGDLSLQFLHVPGHAADQLAVYEPDSGTLWASDILSDVEIPFVSDSITAYEHTLDRLSALDIRVLIPGHGHVTTDTSEIVRRFEEDMTYLSGLRARVTRAIHDGQGVEETVATCRDMAYRHPEINERPHRNNVESVYAELGGGTDYEKVGWNKT